MVVLALSAESKVAVAFVRTVFVEYKVVAVNAEEDAVVKVVCPVTLRVPLDIKEEVAVTDPKVALPPVRDEITPVTALRTDEKKLVLVLLEATRLVTVALVVVELPTTKLVTVAVTALSTAEKKLVEVAFPVMISVKVFTPENACDVVETTPLAVKEAFGILRVWVVPVEEKEMSLPATPTAKNCETPERPLREVMPAPAIPRAFHAVPLYT